MLRRDYEGQHCAIAGTLELVGERWTVLILRDVFLGIRRFDDIQGHLGIARNVLQTRLERLVEEGLLRRRRYQERPERFEYRLTRKGVDLWPVVVSLMQWGDRHLFPDGAPVVLRHKDCGGKVDDHRLCAKCGTRLDAWDVEPELGPGALPSQTRPGAGISDEAARSTRLDADGRRKARGQDGQARSSPDHPPATPRQGLRAGTDQGDPAAGGPRLR